MNSRDICRRKVVNSSTNITATNVDEKTKREGKRTVSHFSLAHAATGMSDVEVHNETNETNSVSEPLNKRNFPKRNERKSSANKTKLSVDEEKKRESKIIFLILIWLRMLKLYLMSKFPKKSKE